MSEEENNRLLIVSAHPDDMEFGCGGTVAKWISEGWEGSLLICTDGRAGTSDPEMKQEDLADIRKKEAIAAANVLGIKDINFLDYPDGQLEDTPDLRENIIRAIRRVKPKIVFTFDPYRRTHNHRDHRNVGQATFDALYPYARDYHHFSHLIDEGLMPHIVEEAYSWTDDPDVWIDITGSIEKKFEALREHVSQIKSPDELFARIKERHAEQGENAGFKYAEGFRVHKFRW
jgi:LmbE family N-acetylglucosaminyl deacetylase|tara:strand:- start:1392 stop:2084 length:693 start_codon:yes stop_codon:yes gene_type:complete